MKSKMCKFVVKDLGVGDGPYNQNIRESVNGLLKDWNNFKPQEMDKLIFALYDLVQSFNEEEELAWFGLSEKWEVRKEFQHLRPKPFSSLLPEERQTEMSKVRRIRPDAVAYKKCRSFKFESKLRAAQSGASNVKVRVAGRNITKDWTDCMFTHQHQTLTAEVRPCCCIVHSELKTSPNKLWSLQLYPCGVN